VSGAVEQLDGSRVFVFRWVERGGPPVAPPTRRGFGSVVLVEAAKSLTDQVALDFDPSGLRYELRVPVAALEPAASPSERASPAGEPQTARA
jgi:two-component sensor histidine kinase